MDSRDNFLDDSTWQDVPDKTVPGVVFHERILQRGKIEIVDHGNGTYAGIVHLSDGQRFDTAAFPSRLEAKVEAWDKYYWPAVANVLP
jgi:hypothetical protein